MSNSPLHLKSVREAVAKWGGTEITESPRPATPEEGDDQMRSYLEECETCRSKPGHPTLCVNCLRWRYLLERLDEIEAALLKGRANRGR